MNIDATNLNTCRIVCAILDTLTVPDLMSDEVNLNAAEFIRSQISPEKSPHENYFLHNVQRYLEHCATPKEEREQWPSTRSIDPERGEF